MKKIDFYIRFGVHKEREVLNEMREHLTGICIPCHILSYSQDPTIAAIKYVNKSYFIDPMTYVYAMKDFPKYLAKKENKKGEKQIKFKPSIQKLTIDLGLVDHFEKNSYNPITVESLDDDLINIIANNSIQVQLNKVNDGKESAVKRYSKLLNLAEGIEGGFEEGSDISPSFLVSPYFYFKDTQDPWFNKNIALFEASKKNVDNDKKLAPFIMTDSETLSIDILDSFEAKTFVLWLTDFDPKLNSSNKQQIKKLRNLKKFIQHAKANGKEIIDMYGSYYSIVLGKEGGLLGICNGVLHGESKSKNVTIGGGAPPVRYYLRKIHEFLSILEAISVLQNENGLDLFDKECVECSSIVKGDVENLDKFEDNPKLAQKHFIHARVCEINFVNNTCVEDIIKDMEKYKIIFKNNFEYKVKKNISNFINNWVSLLKE